MIFTKPAQEWWEGIGDEGRFSVIMKEYKKRMEERK